ncbi:hypothetical protein MXD60_14225, partial [Frankia sp. AgB32]|nr:hypothetical protein [Frankia sp. AgB32]
PAPLPPPRPRAGGPRPPRDGRPPRGLADRAETIGGSLSAFPQPDGGTVIVATLPMETSIS